MHRTLSLFSILVIILTGLVGCSTKPAAETQKPDHTHHQIQGKIQTGAAGNAADAALNAGGPSLYLFEGVKRYRLFVKSPVEVVSGKEYIVDGIYAQKAIDEIGDPSNGKSGYPLADSCQRAVRQAWSGLSFDSVDNFSSALRALIKRYPARAVFLVTKITPKEGEAKPAEEEDLPEVTVPAEKQKASLVEGPTTQPAPLWEPAGGVARCKVLIDKDGKIAELETGAQLCEAVPWAQFRYKPMTEKNHPVNVKTEVEVTFEPRK